MTMTRSVIVSMVRPLRLRLQGISKSVADAADGVLQSTMPPVRNWRVVR
jgi:hypothetical protein